MSRPTHENLYIFKNGTVSHLITDWLGEEKNEAKWLVALSMWVSQLNFRTASNYYEMQSTCTNGAKNEHK